ncbi:MAG: hypothetical protein FJ297_16310 [Planctomycetes bacterium]|nr:hypothetical protein [Planctomycetota bacterium]
MYRTFAVLFVLGASSSAYADPPAPPGPRPASVSPPTVMTHAKLSPEAREAEIARLRQLLFQRVTYPLRLRQLDSEIRIAEAEIRSLDRRVREHESISRPVTSHPFLIELESNKMRRLAAVERLDSLKRERLLLVQNYQIERRLRELEQQSP